MALSGAKWRRSRDFWTRVISGSNCFIGILVEKWWLIYMFMGIKIYVRDCSKWDKRLLRDDK